MFIPFIMASSLHGRRFFADELAVELSDDLVEAVAGGQADEGLVVLDGKLARMAPASAHEADHYHGNIGLLDLGLELVDTLCAVRARPDEVGEAKLPLQLLAALLAVDAADEE